MTDTWDAVSVEELRIAGVLNGGVSLAVWMGGAAHELNRLSWSSPDDAEDQTPAADYRTVLALARSTVVVDVLAGTSAGGINGGALALAQVNKRADLSVLRSLWAEQGRMDNLLRKPFQGRPTSLLRGDDYFLPELNRAMRSLMGSYEPSERHVDLIMPTTLLTGFPRETPDALGQVMRQEVYGASFQFELLPAKDRSRSESDQLTLLRAKARAIALAARASASFPFAFEPTFIPVGDTSSRTDVELRPDMQEAASWAKDGVNRSRYAVDGGALANTPTRQALSAIDKRAASGAVRRLLLLVYPHAPQEIREEPAGQSAPPTVARAALDLNSAIRSTGALTFVDEIEDHNRRVTAWRAGRDDVLPAPGRLEDLYDLIRAGWPAYVGLRRRHAAQLLAQEVASEGWSFERVRQQAELAQTGPVDSTDPALLPQLPYLPSAAPPDSGSVGTPNRWPWGPLVAVGIADAAADILRRALSVAKEPEAVELRPARSRVAALRQDLEDIREAIDKPWTDPAALQLVPDLSYWQARLIAFRLAVRTGGPTNDEVALLKKVLPDRPEEPRLAEIRHELLARRGEQGQSLAGVVREIVDQFTPLADVLARIGMDERGRAAGLRRWLPLLTDPRLDVEPEDAQSRRLMRFLALDTATWLVASAETPGTNLPINLAQLSLAVQHPWATRTTTPDDKAAGMTLARFGGFLKRSWRMNDWTWGRLDAALLLCTAVLDPLRLRRIHAVTGGDPTDRALQVLDRIGLMYGIPDTEEGRLLLRSQEGYGEALDEVSKLFDLEPGTAPPRKLPALAGFAARPIQWRIILEELPFLASAVVADNVDGQNQRSRGNLFLLQNAGLLRDIAEPTRATANWREFGARCLSAFDEAGIGREEIAVEAGSDAIIQTTANAAGVAVTMLDSPDLGVPAIRPFTKAVRGAALLPYWLITGLTRGGSVIRALALAGFMLGGVLLAFGLLGALGAWSSAAAGIGTATVLAAFAYSALRTGSLLHGTVLLGLVVPLVAYVLDQRADQGEAARKAAVTVLVVSGVGIGLALLGSLPWPLASPFAQLGAIGARIRRRWKQALATLAGLLAVGAVVAGAAYGVTTGWREISKVLAHPSREAPWLGHHPLTAVWIGAVVVVLIGGTIAYSHGRSLQLWRAGNESRPPGLQRVTNPAGVAASWAAVYGAAYGALAIAGWQFVILSREEVCPRGGGDECTPVFVVVTVLWLMLLAVVLITVVPTLLTWSFRAAVRRKLAGDSTLSTLAEEELVTLLLSRDLAFRYLVSDLGSRTLTASGRRLHQALDRAHKIRQERATAPHAAAQQAGPAS
jgi:patatin-related protein